MDLEDIKHKVENSHTSLKWIWQVIMGASLFSACQKIYEVIEEYSICQYYDDRCDSSEDKNILNSTIYDNYADLLTFTFFIFTFAFLPLFFRFAYGYTRYLDDRYATVLLNVESANGDAKRVNISKIINFIGPYRGLETAICLVQAVFFLLISRAITEPYLFFYLCMNLLFLNLIWNGYNIFRYYKAQLQDDHLERLNHNTAEVARGDGETPNAEVMHPFFSTLLASFIETRDQEKPLRWWFFNNLVHGLFILFVIHGFWLFSFINPEWAVPLMIFLLFSNSMWDLLGKRDHYFPSNFE